MISPPFFSHFICGNGEPLNSQVKLKSIPSKGIGATAGKSFVKTGVPSKTNYRKASTVTKRESKGLDFSKFTDP